MNADELLRESCTRPCSNCGEEELHDIGDQWCIPCELNRPCPILALFKSQAEGPRVTFKIKVGR